MQLQQLLHPNPSASAVVVPHAPVAWPMCPCCDALLLPQQQVAESKASGVAVQPAVAQAVTDVQDKVPRLNPQVRMPGDAVGCSMARW